MLAVLDALCAFINYAFGLVFVTLPGQLVYTYGNVTQCTSAQQSSTKIGFVHSCADCTCINFMLSHSWQGMDLSQGIAAVVPDWDSVRLLAPHAELRLLACGQASLIAPHRLRSHPVCPTMHLLSDNGFCQQPPYFS